MESEVHHRESPNGPAGITRPCSAAFEQGGYASIVLEHDCIYVRLCLSSRLPDVISTLFPSIIPVSEGRRSITWSELVDNIPFRILLRGPRLIKAIVK